MPLQESPEREPRVNVLLPFGDERTRQLLRQRPDEQWSASAQSQQRYREVRTAAAELERSSDFTPQEVDTDLVNEIIQALSGQEAMRGILGTAAAEPTQHPGHTPYVTLSEVGQVGPPPDAPFLIPEIGVLSVPAPAQGMEGVQSIQSTIQSAVQRVREGVAVEPAAIYYATAEMPDLFNLQQPGAAGLGFPADSLLEAEAGQEWFEAALDEGAAAEVLPWGITRVGAPQAWAAGFFGQGIRVAVVDTGVGPHIDLPAPVASATFVPGTTSANDDHGHGTHVAGTVLARRNGQGVIGVAPLAQLIRVKVLARNGSGQDTWIAAGIVWAANNGARVINISLGSPVTSTTIDRALAYARRRGVIVCAAAGNEFCRPVIHPARNPICIAVAATDEQNRRASFSDCGPELDLSAPGANILSTFPGNTYRVLQGTSMACPHVSGACALVLSKRPALNPTQVQQLLERTALPLGPVNQFGKGLVQAGRAVSIAVAPTMEEMVEEIAAGVQFPGMPAEAMRGREGQPVGAGAGAGVGAGQGRR